MFFSLQQSAFLHALGSAIGNSLWQLAALWLVFAAISGVTKMNPVNRYRLAVFFSIGGFLWFLCSLVLKYLANATAPADAWNIYQDISAPLVTNGFSDNISFVYHSVLASLTSLSPYISCAYLLVWLLLATRLVNGFRQVKQFGTQGLGKVHIDLRLFVQKHSALLNIQKKVGIFTSAYVQSPLTIGFFKPLILLPVASLSHLSAEQVEAILLHELAHIKRHDYVVNIFVQIAEITLFFNPFMRLLLKQIKQERENCCDDYVLQFQYNAADYAKALLGIAQNRTATLLAMGAKNNQFQLLNRVKRMVAPQPQTFNYRQQLYMLCLITVLGLGITMIVPSSTAQAKKENEIVKTTIQPKEVKTIPAAVSEDKDENTEDPSQQPKSYDFVKSIQHLGNSIIAKKMDLEDIQKTGEEIESHSAENEQQVKQITAKALKDAQPEIEKAKLFAEKWSEKMAALDNLNGDVNINNFLVNVSQKINETLTEVANQTNAQLRPAVSPEAPVAPPIAANPRIKIFRQIQNQPERKMLITKEQIEEQRLNAKKTMDSLQAELVELSNTKTQEALNDAQAKLAALKTKDNWDVAFNENANMSIDKAAKYFTVTYATKVNKMLKKLVSNLTADVNINEKNLNEIEFQIKSDFDKLQSDKVNIQFLDKHQERQHRKNTTDNSIVVVEDTEQGS